MSRRVIATEKAPRAIGPYSQGIQAGNLVFTAGQTGVDPATGQLVAGSIEEQTRQTLRNLQAILAAAGCSMADVVKTTVFLADMNDFKAMNSAYAEFFPVAPPARSTVQVSALPLGARIEIEAIAFKAIEDKQE
ncbi:MAG: RidA family protein [Anaerolineae bacterium]